MKASKAASREEQAELLAEALSLLSKEHARVIAALFAHLKEVSKFAAENKMSTENLAICFAPALLDLDSIATLGEHR